MNYIIKNDFYTATLSDKGAELISLKNAAGCELMWQNGIDEEFWSDHAPLLFPVCGRLKDKKYTFAGKEYPMDIHGFASLMTFRLLEKSDTKISFMLSDTPDTLSVYPFSFQLTATYELKGAELLFDAKVKNNSSITMPYMFGWHPGFNLPVGDGLDIESYKLDFGKLEMLNWHKIVNGAFVDKRKVAYPLTNNAYPLCEKEIYENDTMIFTGHKNETSLYAKGHAFRLDMSWSENLPTLCIWKQDDSRAKFICIEPWSSAPKDGVTDENFDIRPMPRLAAGCEEKYHYTVKFSF